ncbi:DVU0298 family protein [Candidatus Magnetomonas plexicatena]|uniref:DVU0298 family protein n=1 Tax=Candidatus Magnetomonas plexicatena TaxID=2552947 RepID=UPI001C78C329|nr:hypothetical protein E2O03_001350 [Nitrospirales bacterium LBB_01]
MEEKFLKSLKKTEMSLRELKQKIKAHIEKNEFPLIEDFVKKDKRALSVLVSMSYDKSEETCWRAAMLTGQIIGRMAQWDSKGARGQVQRLIWNMSDESGTIPWMVPEILGEVVRENPEPFSDIPAIIVGYSHSETEDNIFLAGVLYAIGRIGETHKEYIADYPYILVKESFLHREADVCINAVIAAKRLSMTDIDDLLLRLKKRNDTVTIYYDNRLRTVTISEMIKELFP